MAQSSLPPESRWYDRLSRSSYFFCALLFHLVIFLMVATAIIWPAAKPPLDPFVGVHVPTGLPPTPPPLEIPDNPFHASEQANTSQTSLDTIVSPGTTDFHVKVNVGVENGDLDSHAPLAPNIKPGPSEKDSLQARLPGIKDSVERYHDPTKTTGPDVQTLPFPVYVASYADGDWSCNLHLDKEGNIMAGSMPDLVAKINEWSHGQIKPYVVPKPLNIASSELLDKRPPFIFFTGHKDFHLTDQEIQNLREYLNVGGAIWGDNALPGTGSRFDVAFKREMKRVAQNDDMQFVPFTMQHEVFNNRNHLSQVPEGMNYYAEAPSHLDIDGIPAIIYTPNDYSDLMFLRALPGDKEVYLDHEPPPGTLYTQLGFWENQQIYYRNFNLESSTQAHRFGMNIVTYLLTRFDKLLLLK